MALISSKSESMRWETSIVSFLDGIPQNVNGNVLISWNAINVVICVCTHVCGHIYYQVDMIMTTPHRKIIVKHSQVLLLFDNIKFVLEISRWINFWHGFCAEKLVLGIEGRQCICCMIKPRVELSMCHSFFRVALLVTCTCVMSYMILHQSLFTNYFVCADYVTSPFIVLFCHVIHHIVLIVYK